MAKKNLALVNKDMLIWARSETPFASSIDQLTLRFPRISGEKLRKWESGEELPSIREAKDLAKIYRLPFACFYLSEMPAKKPKRYTDRRTAIGTDYGEMSYELWDEISRILSCPLCKQPRTSIAQNDCNCAEYRKDNDGRSLQDNEYKKQILR